jgi:hypothetical protein
MKYQRAAPDFSRKSLSKGSSVIGKLLKELIAAHYLTLLYVREVKFLRGAYPPSARE